MSEVQKRVLRKLVGDKADQEEGFGSKLMDALDRPGRATRAAIGAFQQDQPIMPAIKEQFGANPPDAPTGYQLAEHVQDKYDIQNPVALAAMATAADVADPTMFIPGGQVTKLGKMGVLSKMAGKGQSAAEVLRDMQKMPKGKYGRVAVKPTAADRVADEMAEKGRKLGMERGTLPSPAQRQADMIKQNADPSDIEKLLQQYPQLREVLKGG